MKIGRIQQLYYFILLIIITSCNTVLHFPPSNAVAIQPGFTATYINKPYKTIDKADKTPSEYAKRNLLNHFDSVTRKAIADSVRIEFTSNGQLNLYYTTGNEMKTASYQGVFSKKGYFDIIFKLKVVKIPPLLPILYSRVERDRLRFYLTKENDLLICKQWVTGGNIFILSGGDSDETKNFFHRAGH